MEKFRRVCENREKTNPINFTVDDFAGKIRCTNCHSKVVFSVQQEAVITIDYFGYTDILGIGIADQLPNGSLIIICTLVNVTPSMVICSHSAPKSVSDIDIQVPFST